MSMAAAPRHEAILAQARRTGLGHLRLVAATLAVCVAALAITGFFDAQRFIDGGPAIAQLASEMVPPDFGRWRAWLRSRSAVASSLLLRCRALRLCRSRSSS